jgi:hypothetical protein
MKRLGPELKMPERLSDLKLPAFLADLYYDLRDRRLLPLVALVVVAIAAVPFLLGDDSEALPEGTELSVEAGEAEAGGVGPATLTVVEANPGLRDYRKRLKRQSPTDPFVQQYTEPTGAAADGSGQGGDSSAASSSGSSAVEFEVTESDEIAETVPPSSGSGGASPGEVDPQDPGLRFFAFRPDIRFGVAGSGDLKLYEQLPLGELLPERNPVLVFIGVSDDGKRVAFDVSQEVAMVKGPGRCIGGPQSCSLLTLKEGEAADILTGKPDRSFRLKIEKIEFVEVKRPNTAGTSSTSSGQGWAFDLAVVGQFQK